MALILTRNVGEVVCIGDNIEVEVMLVDNAAGEAMVAITLPLAAGGEPFSIGPHITLGLIQTHAGQAQLAVKAPRSIDVDRLEIRRSKERES